MFDGANASNREPESMVKIMIIGIELAKSNLSVHGGAVHRKAAVHHEAQV